MAAFNRCKAEGRKVEFLVKDEIEKRYGWELTDVTGREKYHKIDVDFLAMRNNKVFRIEVKKDSSIHKNNRILFEDSKIKRGVEKNGWLHYCGAKYTLHYDHVINTIFVIDFKKAKPFILDNYEKNRYYDKEEKCPVYFRFLPLDVAKEKGFLIREICLDEKSVA